MLAVESIFFAFASPVTNQSTISVGDRAQILRCADVVDDDKELFRQKCPSRLEYFRVRCILQKSGANLMEITAEAEIIEAMLCKAYRTASWAVLGVTPASGNSETWTLLQTPLRTQR